MDLLTNKQYCLITYGCQMNASDSERYAGQLEELGYTMTEDAELADVILMNTCCVRETAEDKVLGKIGEFKHLKAHNNDLIIAVTGCMAQEWQERLFKRAPHLDLVIGTHNIHKLIDLIKEREENGDTPWQRIWTAMFFMTFLPDGFRSFCLGAYYERMQ